MQNLMPYCTLHQTIYQTKVISQKNHYARYHENWTSNFKCYAFLKNHGWKIFYMKTILLQCQKKFTQLLNLYRRTRAKPYGAKCQSFEGWRIFGFRIITKKKTRWGRRKGKSAFAMTFNAIIKWYHDLIMQMFYEPSRPIILVEIRRVVHRGKNILDTF